MTVPVQFFVVSNTSHTMLVTSTSRSDTSSIIFAVLVLASPPSVDGIPEIVIIEH